MSESGTSSVPEQPSSSSRRRRFCCILSLIRTPPATRRHLDAAGAAWGAGLALLRLHAGGVQGSRACVLEALVLSPALGRAHQRSNLFPPPAPLSPHAATTAAAAFMCFSCISGSRNSPSGLLAAGAGAGEGVGCRLRAESD